MPNDKFTAIWLSHSSIGDYLKCPRLYFLRNIYKDPKTGHKITRMQPPLALGQVVHDVIQSLASLPTEERLRQPLLKKLDENWSKISGKYGGFKDGVEEEDYKQKARSMIQRIIDHPGPIAKKAVKMKQELPFFWLSEEDNLILCGKIDWLQYNEEDDTVHIIDFKTGKHEEDGDSLQLPIYRLLVKNCQAREVSGASYWYLQRDNAPTPVDLPNLETAYNRVYEVGKKVALARKLDHFKCSFKEGCNYCNSLEAIVKGRGEFVGTSEYNQDIYIL